MKIFLFLFFILLSGTIYSADLSIFSKGQPQSTHLPDSVYVKVETMKLKNSKVLWFNFDLAKEMGIDFPSEGLTADFEKKVLDSFAYNVPHENMGLENFDKIQKTFFADRYGGSGLGANWGAGRAASAGQFQIKGIGQTDLIGAGQTFDHAHGGASIKESINEAIWGEILHKELPHGANRVLAIIDSGTFTHWVDGGKEPRALIVRQDALRPAHFINVIFGQGKVEQTVADIARVKATLKELPNLLPLPIGVDRSRLSLKDKCHLGFERLAQNWGEQFAAAYARRIYHGAPSPSNIELSGRFLDYGTMTSLPGFDLAKVLGHTPAFGQEFIDGHVAVTIKSLYGSVELYGPEELKKAMPSMDKVIKDLTYFYDSAKKVELAELSGIPRHLLRWFQNSSEFKKFSYHLEILTSPLDEINIDKVMPKEMGRYKISEIMNRLAQNATLNQDKIENALKDLIPENKLRQDFTQTFKDLYLQSEALALRDGLKKEDFHLLVKEKCALRNLPMEEVYRPQLLEKNISLISDYKMNQDRRKIWDHINGHVSKSQRTFSQLSPYQTVIASRVNLLEKSSSHVIYDGKLGKYFFYQEFNLKDLSLNFFGQKIPLSSLGKGMIRGTSTSWKNIIEVPLEIKGNQAIFKLPLESSTEQVEFLLRDESGKQWWKSGNRNIKFKLGRVAVSTSSCWKGIDLILESL